MHDLSYTRQYSVDFHRILRNVLFASAIFLVAFVLARIPEAFDRPIARWLNSFINQSPLFDRFVGVSSGAAAFYGGVLVALIWHCWFGTKDLETRARILIGTLAAVGAGIISRLSQHAFATHPRPRLDPSLSFQAPGGYSGYNTWDSFPSDHVAVFAGLVIIIYIAASRFTIFVIFWTILLECFRIYTGAHYPSDQIGGAGLAAMAVWVAQAPWFVSLGRRLITRWEQLSPAMFYMIAFFWTYQIATLFGDIRTTLSYTFGPLLRHMG
jgi:membrane-associated phospholipid phosphatase